MNTKYLFASALLVAGLVVGARAQPLPVAGDLILGFEASGGTGSAQNFEVDLGQASLFTSSTPSVTIAGLGSTLTNIYGAGWNTRLDLQFAAVAAKSSTGPLYATSSYDQGNPPPAWNQKSSAYYSAVSNSVSTMYSNNAGAFGTPDAVPVTAINSQTSGLGVVLNGINTPKSDAGSWTTSEGNVPFHMSWSSATSVAFNTVVGNTAKAELYQMNAGSGAGTDLGVFALLSDGTLTFTGSAIPEPSTYAAILGAAALGFVMIRRRKQTIA